VIYRYCVGACGDGVEAYGDGAEEFAESSFSWSSSRSLRKPITLNLNILILLDDNFSISGIRLSKNFKFGLADGVGCWLLFPKNQSWGLQPRQKHTSSSSF
jgi:hypothetical protein